MNTIEIWTDTSDEAMYGGGGYGDVDAAASQDKFLDLVLAAVVAKYPGYKVIIHPTNYRNEVEIVDEREDSEDYEVTKTVHEDQDYIRELIGGVWETWDWYVEGDAEDIETED